MRQYFPQARISWLRNMERRDLMRRWMPQGLRDLLNYWGGYAIRYRGEYSDWASARAAADGYDEAALVQRLTHAALAVKGGQAAWEQDGVIRDHIPADMPLFAALSRVALAEHGRLSVLDFGGGLGSSYFQCRGFLAEVDELTWGIVEQAELAAAGRRAIAREGLHFYDSIGGAIVAQDPNVCLVSSVLQYLEDPWAVLGELVAADIRYLIIDRHPCTLNREMITVQVVPRRLYPASYPSWLFDCARLISTLERHYEVLATWEGKDPPIRGWGKGAVFRGYFLRRRERS